MKIPLISKIPVHSIAWSVLAGVIAGLLLVGGQYFLRDVERREQKLETKRYVDELERIVSRNPIRVVGLQAPDEMPEVRPTTKVVDNTGETVRTPIWVTNQWAPDGTIEAYLTTEVNESAREDIRFDSLIFALDRLTVHLGARTGFMSENDRYTFNTIILDTRNDISRLDGFRAAMAESHEEKYAVGMAEPLAYIFFKRLRDSVDWLRD